VRGSQVGTGHRVSFSRRGSEKSGTKYPMDVSPTGNRVLRERSSIFEPLGLAFRLPVRRIEKGGEQR
jgi:hypothetical protein